MKRFWIGITVLTLLLILGIFSTVLLSRSHLPIRDTLEQAAVAALAGDLGQADQLLKKAKVQWDRNRLWTAALVEHGVLEEAECLFAEAEVYAKAENRQALAAACARLAQIMDTIAQSHQTSWQNVL
jgi:thioredoxin-like negative regulator of GroEL